ncbi:MAG: DUF1080 domain-containing protein [Planctomycetota bacterium]
MRGFLVVLLAVAAVGFVASPSLADDHSGEEGFIDLLADGGQQHWQGYRKEGWPEGWKVEDGVLAWVASGDDLMTKAHYADFDLRLEWKVDPGSNSGIMYRVSDGMEHPWLTGPEYQILDNEGHGDGKNTKTSAAALYGLYAANDPVIKPVGEWNETRIVVEGENVQHWLNGQKVVEARMGGDEWKMSVARSKFNRMKGFGKNSDGHIVLQDHGDPVWFRNVRIKRLGGE